MKIQKTNQRLPYISRLFSAHIMRYFLSFFLVSSGVFILTINMWATTHWNNQHPDEVFSLLSGNSSQKNHITLAKLFWTQGNARRGEAESLLAQGNTLFNHNGVLGISSDDYNPKKQEEQTIKSLNQKLSYWTTVITQKPDYRDAYILAGILSYQLGKTNESVSYFTQARLLDPNNSNLDTLLHTLSGITF